MNTFGTHAFMFACTLDFRMNMFGVVHWIRILLRIHICCGGVRPRVLGCSVSFEFTSGSSGPRFCNSFATAGKQFVVAVDPEVWIQTVRCFPHGVVSRVVFPLAFCYHLRLGARALGSLVCVPSRPCGVPGKDRQLAGRVGCSVCHLSVMFKNEICHYMIALCKSD